MDKEMIPAEVIARQAKGQPSSGISDERPSPQTTMHARNEDASVQNELAEWKERFPAGRVSETRIQSTTFNVNANRIDSYETETVSRR